MRAAVRSDSNRVQMDELAKFLKGDAKCCLDAREREETRKAVRAANIEKRRVEEEARLLEEDRIFQKDKGSSLRESYKGRAGSTSPLRAGVKVESPAVTLARLTAEVQLPMHAQYPCLTHHCHWLQPQAAATDYCLRLGRYRMHSHPALTSQCANLALPHIVC